MDKLTSISYHLTSTHFRYRTPNLHLYPPIIRFGEEIPVVFFLGNRRLWSFVQQHSFRMHFFKVVGVIAGVVAAAGATE